MLPEVCDVNDIYAQLPEDDEDSTLTKRRSFADQYLLFCRQNLREHVENNFPSGHESLRDVILIQDDCVTPLRDVIVRVDYAQLTSLYIVDCKLHATDCDAFEKLSLQVLVLSHAHLRSVPQQVFDMADLQVLKLDRNRLDEIPADISRLRSLQTFCCDSQRPRLRSLPGAALRQLPNLQVLTFSNNRIDDISWCDGMTSLRTLKCDRNRLTRLPYQLASLPHLQVLDVSHNRLDAIPATQQLPSSHKERSIREQRSNWAGSMPACPGWHTIHQGRIDCRSPRLTCSERSSQPGRAQREPA